MKLSYKTNINMKLRKIIITLFLIISAPLSLVQAEDEWCDQKEWFEIYNCRVKAFCNKEEYKSDKPVYTPKETYEEATALSDFEDAKEIYRTNMANIYKCHLIQIQKNVLETRIKKLIKEDKTWKLDEYLGEKIKNRKTKLDNAASKVPCSLTEKESFHNKEKVLKETSHEMCKYINFLEYFKVYAKDLSNTTQDETDDKFSPTYISRKMVYTIYEIEEEIAHTYEIYPLAFQAYSDYENLFPIHLLLEVIKEDFKVLRQKLYEALMPIAQVWYKIINAMSY